MLGRPLPLFDHVAQQLAHQVTQRLQHSGHRSVHIVLTQAHWHPLRPSQHAGDTTAVLARASVLAFMQARYGFNTDADIDQDLSTISTTEQRIAANAQAWVVQALDEVLPTKAIHDAPATHGHAQLWQWQALLDIDHRGPHPISLTLDAGHSHALEQYIHTLREEQQGQHPTAPPATAPLHVQVVARVMEKTVAAADIYNLHPGSIVPIALGRATVLLNDSAMLTASVAEHQGKLHLTAFENLE